MKTIFITGGTGYLGSRLIGRLLAKGYTVRALARKGSEHKLPQGCEVFSGDALDANSYQDAIPQGCTFIHLVGVAHPSPRKVALFKCIDLVSIQEAVKAVQGIQIEHFIYVSVVQVPTKIMAAYQAVRAEGERLAIHHILKKSKVNGSPAATFLRPWYVLGPGHWWPRLLLPFYWIAKHLPALKEKVYAFDLVTLNQMLDALEFSIENSPTHSPHILEVQNIKSKSHK